MLRKHSKILIKQIKNKNYTFIDYCLIAFAIFVLSFLAYTSLIRKTAPLFVDLTFQRQKYFDTPIPPEYWQVDNIKAGDVAYNSLGNKIAEVVEVEKSYWNGGSRKNILITLQLKAQYHKKTKALIEE